MIEPVEKIKLIQYLKGKKTQLLLISFDLLEML